MANCPNCKATLTCGCQKRKAKDGKAVCSKCLATYEAGLTQRKTITVKPQTTTTWGKNRYKTN